MWTRTIDCLGIAVGIRSQVPGIGPQLEAVFRTYADATRPAELEYLLEVGDWPRVVRDREIVGRYDAEADLVPALELDLYAQVTSRATGLLLHAGAVVGAGGACLVFAGRSGAGKSTLVRALLARGFSYLTEECVALSPGGRCIGLARALHLEDDALAVPAGFSCEPYVLRGRHADEHPLRLLHPPEHAVWRTAARAVAVIAIDHAPDARGLLEPLTGGEALVALWPAVFRTQATATLDAVAALEGVARFRLHTAHPAQALDAILALATELSVVPQ